MTGRAVRVTYGCRNYDINRLCRYDRRPLDNLAALVANVREQQDKLLPSDRKRDARSVAKAAWKLLEKVSAFGKSYPVESHTENYRDTAIAAYEADFEHRLSDDERRLFCAGMSSLSYEWPLLGVFYHMQAIAALPSKDGPRTAVTAIYRHALSEVARHFKRASIPTNGKGRSLFLDTCKAVLSRAGYPATDDEMKHYARNIGGRKNLTKPR